MTAARYTEKSIRFVCRQVDGIATRARRAFRRVGTRADEATDRLATSSGRLAARAAWSLLLFPHREETVNLPEPLAVGAQTVDVIADRAEYTTLDRPTEEALLRRKADSFRAEWQALPAILRHEVGTT